MLTSKTRILQKWWFLLTLAFYIDITRKHSSRMHTTHLLTRKGGPSWNCCDIGQNDTIGKNKLNQFHILSSIDPNCSLNISVCTALENFRANGNIN